MVCNRCISVVKNEFEKAGFKTRNIVLGEVELEKELSKKEMEFINTKLIVHGFEFIDDKKGKLIEKIKNVLIKQIHYSGVKIKINYSHLITDELHKDYSYLSNLFSEIEGITIEQYIILQKIEKAKELLVYDELNLSQISDELGYSSVSHLSRQFKKITGLTPSHFKIIKDQKRVSLDNVKPINNTKPFHISATSKP
jgi:AraC-like DNA-binding protein